MNNERIVWESLVDYHYRCFVTQLSENVGRMSIVDCRNDNKLIWSNPIEINKNHLNITQWSKDALFVIDRLNKNKK